MNFLVSNAFTTLDECHTSICMLMWHLHRRIIHFINLKAKISSPLTASEFSKKTKNKQIINSIKSTSRTASATTICITFSRSYHSRRQFASYKCIDSIKKKITDKSTNTCDTNSKIPYQRRDIFNREDSDRYASTWLLYRGSSFDHKPLWLSFSYKQNIWMFLRREKQNKTKQNPKWQMQK